MVDYNAVAARLMQTIIHAKPYEAHFARTHVRASEVSNCIKQTYYAMTLTPVDEGTEERADTVSFIFDYGNMFESIIEKRLIWAKQAPSKLRLPSNPLGVSGETDAALEYEGIAIVTESKGTNRRNYTRIVNDLMRNKPISEVTSTYYSQLQVYLWVLRGLDVGMLVIGNRDMAYVDTSPPFIIVPVERNNEWFMTNSARIKLLTDALRDGQPPIREYKPGSWQCNACAFFKRCYDGDTLVPESNSKNSGVSGQPVSE
jgi:hypothetical protein